VGNQVRAGGLGHITVVQSLRFPTLREGTNRQHRYYVLDVASRYPTDSVTTFRAPSLPRDDSSFSMPEGFHLVHAPRAFYVVKQIFQSPSKPSSTCPVAFDPKTFQFFCPGTDLRWDRLGQPLGAAIPARNTPPRMPANWSAKTRSWFEQSMQDPRLWSEDSTT
jgi:hypothetical protein